MIQPQCAKCGIRFCSRKEFDRTELPEFYPMKQSPELIENAVIKYDSNDFSEYSDLIHSSTDACEGQI